MSIARSGLALFGTRSISAVIGFGAIVVFARELGIAALGSYFLFQALLEIVTLGADAGLKSAVEKRMSEGVPASAILGTGVALKTAFLAVGSTVILALREPIAGFVGADLAVLLVCVAVLREFGRLTTFALRGELRVPDSAMVELIQKGVYVVAGTTLAFRGFGVRAPVYGLVAGYAVMVVVGAVRMDTRPGLPSTRMARSLLSYARYKFVSQVGAIGYSWIDVLVIGVFLSPAAVGAYEVAWKVANVATMFSDALATSAFPRMSEYSGQNALNRIEDLFPRLLVPSLAIVIPAFFGAAVLSREILGIVFGPEYVGATLALVVLMADSVSTGVYKPVGRTLRALDRPDLDARATVVQLVLNGALNLALVPRYGILGAAVATGIGGLSGNTLALVSLARLITIRAPWRAVRWSAVAAAGMAGVVWIARESIGVTTAIELVAVVGLGIAVYGGLAVASPSLRVIAVDGLSSILPERGH